MQSGRIGTVREDKPTTGIMCGRSAVTIRPKAMLPAVQPGPRPALGLVHPKSARKINGILCPAGQLILFVVPALKAKLIFYFFEHLEGIIQILAGMGGRHLSPDARLPFWYHRVEKTDHITTLGQHLVRHFLRQ